MSLSRRKPKERGITLVEVLVALVVMSIGLLGISSFGIAFLRWTFTRSRIRTFGAFLAGIGMIAFAFFLNRYSLRTLSGSLVISLEAAVLAGLLFIYIGSGLYWTSARRRALVAAAYRAPRP